MGEEGDIIFLNYYIRDINYDNLSKVSRLSLKRYKNASAKRWASDENIYSISRRTIQYESG